MKSDAAFLADLEASQPAVLLTGARMEEAGFDMHMPFARLRPTSAERSAYRDRGDLWLVGRVQVKHQTKEWTGAENYGHKMVMVDEIRLLQPADIAQLWGYVLVNRPKTHCGVILASTARLWVPWRYFDEKQQRDEDVYRVPLGSVVFGPFEPAFFTQFFVPRVVVPPSTPLHPLSQRARDLFDILEE